MSEKKAKKSKKKTCTDHPDEELKFYCTAHNDVICCICAVKRHKLCQDTLTFPEAIERFERERNNLFKALDNQSKVIGETLVEKREALEAITPEARQIKFKLRTLRSTLYRIIDKSESELLQKTEELERQESLQLAEYIQNLEDLSSIASKVKQNAEEAFDKNTDLSKIKSMVKVQNAYCEIERSAKEAIGRQNKTILFDIAQSVQEFIDSFDSLGTISSETKESLNESGTDATNEDQPAPGFLTLRMLTLENISRESTSGTSSESRLSRLPSSLEDIESSSEDESSPSSDDLLASGDDNDVTVMRNSPDDPDNYTQEIPAPLLCGTEDLTASEVIELSIAKGKPVGSFTTVDHGKPCWLYGIAYMPDERLVITDVAHDSLQLYDKTCRLLNETRVSFTPWDVVAVTRNTVGVCTGGKGTINTFSIQNNEFALLKTLDVGSDCISLAYSNNIFTAGTRKGGILISEDGEIISRIEKNSSSREVFRRADFLAIDDESKNIFISNAWASKIVCVTPDGRKLWESQTKGSNQRGLLWINGRLLVASRNQHKVISLDGAGGFIDDVVTDCLKYPYAITLHPVAKLLAVTQWDEKMSSEKSRTVNIFEF